jgi:hypothetical protein
MNQLIKQKISFSVSQVQQTSWFLYQLASEGVNDKLSLAVRIKSSVNSKAIKDTFQELIDRHANAAKPLQRT